MESKGTLNLYSRAYPSHRILSKPTMLSTTTNFLTHSATYQPNRFTHHVALHLCMDRNKPIKFQAVVNHHLHQKLLSVHDLAQRYGRVTFIATYGRILNSTCSPVSLLAIAPYKGHQYQVRGTVLRHISARMV